MVISVVNYCFMIVVTIKTNFEAKDSSKGLDEYPSGLIEDLPSDQVDENIDTNPGLEKNEVAPDFKLPTLTGWNS